MERNGCETGGQDKAQPWEFIVVRNRETMRKLGEAYEGRSFMADSAAIMVFLANPERSPLCYHEDVAVTVQNFLLAKRSLGLGTCWIGVINSEHEQQTRRLLGIPENSSYYEPSRWGTRRGP